MRVLLDTNFLLIPFTNHVDIFEEIERLLTTKVKFVILQSTIAELRNLKGRQKGYAGAMLNFIANQPQKFEIINIQGKADDLILDFARKNAGDDFYVATMDKFLRDKVRKSKVKVFVLRDKGKIELL